jgi:hypothetical protein
MKKTRKTFVITGGLGNQLFQLAAGLTSAGPQNLILERNLGKPRLNAQGYPDLDSFVFPTQLNFTAQRKWKLMLSNVGSLAFKISSKEFKNRIVQTAWLGLKAKFENLSLFLSDGVGFDPRLTTVIKPKWFFGPFHTYQYVQCDSTHEFMRAMYPRIYPDWLRSLSVAAVIERPIILHIRLTDYLNIQELGILRADYFKRSLEKAIEHFPHSRIWLFTDEENLALRFLDNHYSEKIRIINYDQADTAANLEAMRLGNCYVISNSTFSWWGAYLSHSPEPKVFCPKNWFRTKQNPSLMIPKEWEAVDNL